MRLKDALQILLSESGKALFDWYGIEYYVFSLYKEKRLGDAKISITKQWPSQADIMRYAYQLVESGFLSLAAPRKRKTSIFYITASNPHHFELVCHNHPVYISHLSAIITHGLTDRRSNTIWATRSAAINTYQNIRYIEHLQNLEALTGLDAGELNSLSVGARHIPLLEKVRDRPIHYFSTTRFRKEYFTKTERYSISTIGKTFLDMVEKPDFCGGIDHVIQIYSAYGKTYANKIIHTADNFASKISKCRIGYLLEQESDVSNNDTLNKWANQDIQRGGTRKLNPQYEYSPNYSERWCLSINID